MAGSTSWQINVKTKACDDCVTCQKTLHMMFGSKEVIATGSAISVDGRQIPAGENYNEAGIIIEKRGDYIYLRYSDGVKVKWSVDTLSVFLTVESRFMGKLKGLCGDYDGKSDDKRFLLDNGKYETDVNVFANSYRVNSGVII